MNSPQATLDTVERALVALRSRQGITQRRVEEHPVLLALPAVDAEMRRAGIVDRAVAAYRVIECAVGKGVGRTDLRLVLLLTMNLSGAEGDSLDKRREIAREKLQLRGTSYEARESIAYRELASVLIRRTDGCCGDSAPAQDLNTEQNFNGQANQADQLLAAMREILKSLLVEMVDEAKVGLASALLDLCAIPDDLLDPASTPLEQVSDLLERAVTAGWDASSGEDLELLKQRIITPAVTIELGYNAVLRISTTLSIDGPLVRHLGLTPDEDTWRPKARAWAHRAADWLAEILCALREQQLWTVLYKGRVPEDIE